MQAKAALLLEANCTSERFPAFIRNAQKSYDEKCYNLPEPVILNHEFQDNTGNTITASITVNTFEIGNINADGKPWGLVYCPALLNKSRKEIQCNVTYSHQPCVWSVNEKSDLLFALEQDIKEIGQVTASFVGDDLSEIILGKTLVEPLNNLLLFFRIKPHRKKKIHNLYRR